MVIIFSKKGLYRLIKILHDEYNISMPSTMRITLTGHYEILRARGRSIHTAICNKERRKTCRCAKSEAIFLAGAEPRRDTNYTNSPFPAP